MPPIYLEPYGGVHNALTATHPPPGNRIMKAVGEVAPK
jgi:hypothetical protein